jgi:cytosine/adenosine deaminase-related metal-dependent hydrolase
MRKITADKIYPISSAPLENTVLITDDLGKILAIEPLEQHDPASVARYHGALVPGFVNTHCHLELSHMKGKVPTGTGLIPFITGVVTQRNAPAEIIADAIERAEQEMLEGGIVAIGDISNSADTFPAKSKGRLRYHTFLELFDFLQNDHAEKTFSDGKAVWDKWQPAPGSAATMVPHAPYSVSETLFKLINAFNRGTDATVSIHNQETPPEQALFMHGTGAFFDFYGKFGISLEKFKPNGKPSIYYALQHLDPSQRTLFVHNTLTSSSDIEAAQAWNPRTYWATCPNANLYIENRLPNYSLFLETGARLTIGTDSLTSNWQLSVLEEMKTISRYQSYVPFEAMLRWATLNGAEALGFEDSLGSLEPGKTPGLLLLENLGPDGLLSEQTRVRRIL